MLGTDAEELLHLSQALGFVRDVMDARGIGSLTAESSSGTLRSIRRSAPSVTGSMSEHSLR